MWIDTHCHLDAPEFDGDRDTVRARAAARGVGTLVLPGVDRHSWDAVHALAHRHGDVYALGIHPMYTPQAGADDLAALREALAARRDDPRLVAVGEIGIDLFVQALREGAGRERQEVFYREQLRLARAFDLPVILHVRRSADVLLRHLRELPVRGGIVHAFNGSAQQAWEFVRMGLRLGFGGAMTFERALQLRRLALELPAGSIVLETDAPDIPPQWIYQTARQRQEGRAQGRNEPGELPAIGQVLARLRGVDVDELACVTSRNAIESLAIAASVMAVRP